MTRHRLLTPRWLATGGAVVLAGIVSITLLVDRSPACAAPPTTTTRQGQATHYDLAGPQGSCSYKPPADDLYVALGRTQFSDALSCGGYLDVTGPRGTVRVKVFDACPECTVGWLDLSRTAYGKIADPSTGLAKISYRAVPNAPTPGPLSITFVSGSSRYWWAISIDNQANPIATVSAKRPGGSWMTATRTDYNYWLIDHDTGSGPFTIKMTDIYGHTASAAGIKLQPGKKQTTSVRLGSSVTTKSAPKASPTRAKKKSPAPTAKTSASASPAASLPESLATPSPAPSVASSPAEGQAVALTAAPAKACR